MPIMIDSVFYELALHDADFAAALRKSVANLDQLDAGAKKAGAGVGGLENGMKAAGKEVDNLARKAAGAESILKKTFGTLITGFAIKEFIQNTTEAQAVLAQLEAAVRSTGGAAGFTVPELVAMSEEMAKLSAFSDEAVQGGLARLLTYTGIQGPMFKEAARATLDFAQALRIDVTSAAERVGNALQYPTEAINSLTKQGFRFTAEQKRVIADFERTGQLAKAQAVILGELDLAYARSAAAARDTLGGALQGLKNDFTNTLEVSRESSGGIIEAINAMASALPSVRTAFNSFFGGINLLAIDAVLGVTKFRREIARLQMESAAFTFNIPGLKEFSWNAMNRAKATRDEIDLMLPGLEEWRKQEERLLLGLDTPPAARKGGTAKPPPPKGLSDTEIQAQASARMAFASAIAAQTAGTADNFETQVERLVTAAEKAHIGASEIQKMVADLRSAHATAMAEESKKLGEDLQGQMANLTATTADDLQQQLAEFDRAIAEARAKGLTVDPELVAQLRAAKEQAIELAPWIDELATDLERIEEAAKTGFNLSGALAELDQMIEVATAIRDASPAGSADREGAQKRLNALIAKEAEIRKQLRTIILASADDSKKFAMNVEQLSGQIANAANAAFGLASAFLGVDSNITRALGSIGQLAGGVNAVSGLATAAGGFGALFSTAGGIASALPGIGAAVGGAMALAGSLFGKDPQVERARQETTQAMRELKSALYDLRDVYLQDVSSVNVAADIALVEQILKGLGTNQWGQVTFGGNRVLNPGEGNGPGRRGNLRDIGRSVGQDFDSGALLAYFRELDSRYGTNLASFIEREDPYGLLQALRDVPAALQTELGELGRFADDAAGTIAKVNYGLDLLGKSTAAERFRAIIQGLTAAGISLGEFADELNELADPATTAERVNEIVAAVLERLSAGGADFGDLTPEELRDLFRQGVDAARGVTAGTGGFNVSRTITEVTGNRLEALFTTGNIFAEQTARNTGMIAALMGGTALPVIQAPSVGSAGALGMGGTTIVFEGGITVHVGGVLDRGRAIDVGRTVGESLIETVDQQLAARAKWAGRARGILN